MTETKDDKIPQSFIVRCFTKNDNPEPIYKYVPLPDLDFPAVSPPVVGDIIVSDTKHYVVVKRQFEIAEGRYRISRCALLVEETEKYLIEG